ncbi:MAG: adenosylcobinamide-GDP ribazoletransferase [Firmicutes bacterium]|uniref:Adenosylcobinamide-GDP ribazoletransferase n=1 Tax=Candidatus Scybalomonas excrementavium TaxID=2840943 RepID=A0A9D9HZS0_9FIRM|nr:adenosylcobinamide-GDP ribazoletransferase [Candidatus Scybalomonas excrementavium]
MVMLGTGVMNWSYAIKTGFFEQNTLPVSSYLILGAFKGFLMSVVLFIVAKSFRSYIEKKIGGITGDAMGAGSEVCELMYLLLSHCHLYM